AHVAPVGDPDEQVNESERRCGRCCHGPEDRDGAHVREPSLLPAASASAHAPVCTRPDSREITGVSRLATTCRKLSGAEFSGSLRRLVRLVFRVVATRRGSIETRSSCGNCKMATCLVSVAPKRGMS